MISNVDFILGLLTDWFADFADNNNQKASFDSDGFARLNGEFDLRELAELLDEEL